MTIDRELEREIQTLNLDEAIGCLRTMITGEWIAPKVLCLIMRGQRGILSAYTLPEAIAADWFALPSADRTKERLLEMLR